jgi:predicted secreted protein
MATVINGKTVVVLWDTGVSHGNEAVIACSTNATLTMTQDTTQVSCKDTATGAWAKSVEAQKSWEITCDALYMDDDASGTGGFVDLADLFITGPNEVNVVYGGTATGDNTWYGKAIVSSLTHNAPDNDSANYSATFTGNGPLMFEVVGP